MDRLIHVLTHGWIDEVMDRQQQNKKFFWCEGKERDSQRGTNIEKKKSDPEKWKEKYEETIKEKHKRDSPEKGGGQKHPVKEIIRKRKKYTERYGKYTEIWKERRENSLKESKRDCCEV